MKGEIADQAVDRKVEDKHEAEEKKRIIQHIEEVLGFWYLSRLNFFDAVYEVYQLAQGDEHMAMLNNYPDWIGEIRDEVCSGGG